MDFYPVFLGGIDSSEIRITYLFSISDHKKFCSTKFFSSPNW